MKLRNSQPLPLRAPSAALAFGLGTARFALGRARKYVLLMIFAPFLANSAEAAHLRHYQCAGELQASSVVGVAKITLNLATGSSWKDVKSATYNVELGSNPLVIDGALHCGMDPLGYSVCRPVGYDGVVHSFAVYRIGAFVTDGAEKDGQLAYAPLECVETAE